MREQLFRGQRKDNGEWVEGSVINNPYSSETFIVEFDAPFHTWIYEVIPETVGQYIGRTDKNGKKIFENDILKGFRYPFECDGEHNYYAKVVWFDNCPAFGIYTFKAPNTDIRGISEGNTEHLEDFKSELWEVIGNIHDNPELLEVQE